MGLAVRTFLCSFVPLIVLLSGGSWIVEQAVVSIVHDGLRSIFRNNQASAARVQARSARQNQRYLRIVGENAALKAGLQLLLADPNSDAARLTVEDQLREICSASHIDLLFVSRPDGLWLAGVIRDGQEMVAIKSAAAPSTHGRLLQSWRCRVSGDIGPHRSGGRADCIARRR